MVKPGEHFSKWRIELSSLLHVIFKKLFNEKKNMLLLMVQFFSKLSNSEESDNSYQCALFILEKHMAIKYYWQIHSMYISLLSGSIISIKLSVNLTLYTFCRILTLIICFQDENHSTIADNICSQGFNDLTSDDTDFQVSSSIKFQFVNNHIKSKIQNKMSWYFNVKIHQKLNILRKT